MNSKKLNGLFVINKIAYISSNKILQIVRNIIKIKKIGYVGTLDPLSIGFLPIIINDSTRFSDDILKKKRCI